MTELAELVIEICGSSSTIEAVSLPEGRRGDPARRRPDIARAQELLGWEPTVGLRDGLALTVEALRAEMAGWPG